MEEIELVAAVARLFSGALGGGPAGIQAMQRQEYVIAESRARELLISLLDKKQRADFAKTGQFTVKSGGGEFRLGPDLPCGIVEYRRRWRRKVSVRHFCVHPNPSVAMPYTDRLITFLVWLRAAPKYFRNVAVARGWQRI